nr:type II CAAX endopeptidase family protein [Halorubellus sp. JP-L1]
MRASLRGVLPAAVTLLVLLAGRAAIQTVFEPAGTALSAAETVSIRVLLFALYVATIGIALRIATTLDRRRYAEFGLSVDAAWLGNFAAGTVISAAGIALSLWWGVARGHRAVDLSSAASGVDEPLLVAVALLAFALYFLLGNVYEEVVYRGIMLQNFAEGLSARGRSPAWAVVPATAGSLLLFGAYHVPLRGNVVVGVDAAMVGVTFALAYLLTGDLGLPLGVHFGRMSLELLSGFEMLGVELTAALTIARNTLPANLEVRLLELGCVCLLVVAWAYLTEGHVGVAKDVYEPTRGDVDARGDAADD